jgi:uncharacterized protein YbjQ (UPF0145 family)
MDAMPFFNRNKPAKPTDEELEAAEVDLERIRQGGIPLGAEQRLKRISTVSTPFFTSDLSAKEYAVAQAGGLQPIAQVMGSSVVKHGWNQNQGFYYTTGELPALSQPWNMVRERAFDRMLQEATLAGADAVVAVKLNTNGTIGDSGNVELVVFGTAVRDPTLPEKWRPSSPDSQRPVALSTLSAQDVDKLRRIGAEICGVVGHTTVLSVQLDYASQWIMNSSAGFIGAGQNANAEIPEITQAVYQARHLVMRNVEQQAKELGANQLVMSALNHSIDHYEYEYGGRRDYFHVTMHVLGTAIRLGVREPHPEPLKTPMMSINLGDQS